VPQSTPQPPLAVELQAHTSCEPEATQAQIRRAPDASHCSHVVCRRGSHVLPLSPQFVEPHAVEPAQLHEPWPAPFVVHWQNCCSMPPRSQ
jgi:hypothetical protein